MPLFEAPSHLCIPQRGVQWKQGVVIYRETGCETGKQGKQQRNRESREYSSETVKQGNSETGNTVVKQGNRVCSGNRV